MPSVVIPWRPSPSRIPAFDDLLAWYARELPEFTVTTIDSGDEPFSLAACRNAAFASGETADADADEPIVINDADTLPEPAALRAAVEAARTSGRVELPYDEYRWLGAEGTAQLRAGVAPEDCSFELVNGACSGVYVTTRRSWDAHGGQDERFRGWGFEDAAWELAHRTLLGTPPGRQHGRVYALHHVAAERAGTQYDANAALMDRYLAASGDESAMLALVGEGLAWSAANASSGPGARR